MRKAIQANAVAYYTYFIGAALIGFVTSPILITHLGVTAFGALKSVQKLLDIASVADGRSGQALKWTIARSVAKSDELTLARFCTSSVHVAFAFTPLLVLIALALAFFSDQLINTGGVEIELETLVLILGANFALSPLLSIPDAVLTGSNRGYASTSIQLFWLVVTNIGVVLAARNGYGLSAVAAAIVIGATLNAICVFFVARRTTPWFRWATPSRGDFRRFIGLSGWLLVWAGVEKALLSGEVVIAAVLLNASAASIYVLNSYSSQLFLSVLLLTVSAAAPSLARLMVEKKGEVVLSQIIQSIRHAVFALSVVAASLMLILNKSFVGLWVGEEFFVGGWSNFLLAILMVQAALIRCDAQIGDLTLDVRKRSVAGLISTLLTVALPVGLGALFGMSLGIVLVAIFTARLLLSFASMRVIAANFGSCRLPVMTVALALAAIALSYWVGVSLSATSWYQLVAIALIALAGAVIVGFFVVPSPSRRLILELAIMRKEK